MDDLTYFNIELRVALASLVSAVEAIWDDPSSPLSDEVCVRFQEAYEQAVTVLDMLWETQP